MKLSLFFLDSFSSRAAAATSSNEPNSKKLDYLLRLVLQKVKKSRDDYLENKMKLLLF